MSGQENQNEKLTSFEKKLAAMRPQSGRFDSEWRTLLAQEAAGDNAARLDADVPFSSPSTCCGGSAQHQFVCIQCGCEFQASRRREKRRWAWPGAFSGMSIVAVTLFVALLVERPRSAIDLEAKNHVAATRATASTSENRQISSDATPQTSLGFGEAFSQTRPMPMPIFISETTSYKELRDQTLYYGVESWRTPVTTTPSPRKTSRPSHTAIPTREQLLKQWENENAI